MKISLLTGGDDPTYALPLSSVLCSKGVNVDFIGSDSMLNSKIPRNENVNYLNFRGDQNPNAPLFQKVFRVLKYYYKLVRYAARTDSKLFHILWLNKFVYFDRTVLNIYYKILGKKLVFTAHNVNAAKRDGHDSLMNRLTLRFMYNTVDHIFVHTEKMKMELIDDFGIEQNKITVIPFGINNVIPQTKLTRSEARQILNLGSKQRVLLFFGQIASYKGLKYLVLALRELAEEFEDIKLVIAGKIKKGHEKYWESVSLLLQERGLREHLIERIEFIPDEEVEIYFKAADVLILPYTFIYQSGPLFLAYNFGLPVIATDVGSFSEEIIEHETGLICKRRDPKDLADKIALYYESQLFKNLESNRANIIRYANEKYSWEKVADITVRVYKNLQK